VDKARSNPLKIACCILFIYAEKEISIFPFAKLSICMKFYLSQALSHIWSYLDSQIKEFPSSSSAPISWKGARNYFIFKKKKKHWRASLIYCSLYCGGRPNSTVAPFFLSLLLFFFQFDSTALNQFARSW